MTTISSRLSGHFTFREEEEKVRKREGTRELWRKERKRDSRYLRGKISPN